MQVNLRQIEVFRAIMVAGSISGAAKLLCVSQPAISRMISHTESRLGLKLFERIKGRLYPTPEARRLFVEVNAVHQGLQRVNDVANDLIEKNTGALQLVVSPSLGQTLIPTAIARFRKRFPKVRINIVTQTSTQLVQTLLTRQAELGVAMFSLDHPNIEQQSIYEDHLVAVLPQDHPLASRPALHVRDLENVDLIGYSADTPFGGLIQQLFATADVAMRLAVEVRLTHAACALVQAGVGVTIADEVAVLGQVWPGVVIRPLLPDITMDVNVLHARFEPLSGLAHEFLNTLTELDVQALRRVA
ncbi:LysR substrate-binding domain-containing protein [Paraburkholderia caballeronis]|uniref:DNA-binding transcriptional regulator, LysR family n=1 Tax=Paraburkholderia caballeronis TaxID=416943 RepID=A0A1H7FHF8_9BURK|nr:LysR substrate-binding domain-containing protein [Paraburkholderia caballeronis]PXW24981.1 LysR family transcriptional regulator [Paraburkholderia caballeronis]PXX00711.1 LysR family transcriptional regulator [Paraburkholderia caballeronis]RAJ98774.1 LysR family transcriptional regulator [Paraburkholderia caballeronis]TDV16409.1 LysR family transcriptional regulator [Paraburkholderia caballeronis]TDV18805.1 LysR family transcriptional regulator [Paraburkholderia caballeronis]